MDAPAAARRALLPDKDHDVVPYAPAGGWPRLTGQLLILFSSRSGSTFLCRRIERTRRVSAVGEAFNRGTLERDTQGADGGGYGPALARAIERSADAGWFLAKAGIPGLSIAERLGYVDATIDRTRLWLLLRRDLIGQAISHHAAKISGRYHSTNRRAAPVMVDDYDEAALIGYARVTLRAAGLLRDYARASGRPTALLHYEEFADGDFARVDRLLDAAGVPRRVAEPERPRAMVERLVYPATAAWRERLVDSKPMRRLAKRHARQLDEIAREFPADD